ncbi:hypothetical protein EBZ38_00895 [bacterium]|nr:hypothetical protein [bacterium]NBX97880.1 hypothetical protein [bacterium]NDC93880.1 hypothetical protein [bacterium]NDD82827.1 hypothetical protein [bacterium]
MIAAYRVYFAVTRATALNRRPVTCKDTFSAKIKNNFCTSVRLANYGHGSLPSNGAGASLC